SPAPGPAGGGAGEELLEEDPMEAAEDELDPAAGDLPAPESVAPPGARLMRLSKAARELGYVTPGEIRGMIKRGEIKRYRIGMSRAVKVDLVEIARCLSCT